MCQPTKTTAVIRQQLLLFDQFGAALFLCSASRRYGQLNWYARIERLNGRQNAGKQRLHEARSRQRARGVLVIITRGFQCRAAALST